MVMVRRLCVSLELRVGDCVVADHHSLVRTLRHPVHLLISLHQHTLRQVVGLVVGLMQSELVAWSELMGQAMLSE